MMAGRLAPHMRRIACFAKSSQFKTVEQRRYLSSDSPGNQVKEAAGKFSKYFRKYGLTFVGTYLSIYVATLGSIFLALDFDVFCAADFGFDAKKLTEKVLRLLLSLCFILNFRLVRR